MRHKSIHLSFHIPGNPVCLTPWLPRYRSPILSLPAFVRHIPLIVSFPEEIDLNLQWWSLSTDFFDPKLETVSTCQQSWINRYLYPNLTNPVLTIWSIWLRTETSLTWHPIFSVDIIRGGKRAAPLSREHAEDKRKRRQSARINVFMGRFSFISFLRKIKREVKIDVLMIKIDVWFEFVYRGVRLIISLSGRFASSWSRFQPQKASLLGSPWSSQQDKPHHEPRCTGMPRGVSNTQGYYDQHPDRWHWCASESACRR